MHPTTPVTYGDLRAEIDNGLVSLVRQMWQAGIVTSGCCQNAEESLRDLAERLPGVAARAKDCVGRAYLQFHDPDPLCDFFEALANAGPRDSFYERMTQWAAVDAWRVTVMVADVLSEEDEPDWANRSLFYASTLHLEFPVHDIEEMARRLTAHNAGASAFGGEPTWPTTSLPT